MHLMLIGALSLHWAVLVVLRSHHRNRQQNNTHLPQKDGEVILHGVYGGCKSPEEIVKSLAKHQARQNGLLDELAYPSYLWLKYPEPIVYTKPSSGHVSPQPAVQEGKNNIFPLRQSVCAWHKIFYVYTNAM